MGELARLAISQTDSADGVERVVEATAFPLYARADEFVGGVTVFWGKHEEG